MQVINGKCKTKCTFSVRHLRSSSFCFKIRAKKRMNGWILSWIAPPIFAQISEQNERLQRCLLRKMLLKFSLS
uniref:Uncharacterized protein n=1 Tax=Arundo donax TaxID=35708 RepID=A0A0A8YU15_ARUDO